MRRVWLAGLPFVYVLVAACVGDDPSIASSSGGDGGPPADTTGQDGSTPGVDPDKDASSDDGATAEKRCGYPGEDCCEAPTLPCREGTVCGTANRKCMVSDVGVVGEFGEVQGGTFVHRVTSAFFDGKDWTVGPDVMTESSLSGFSSTDLIAGGPQNYEVTLSKSSEGKMFNYYSSAWRKCEPGQACTGPTLPPPAFWSVARIANDTWIGATDAIYRCVAGSSCTKEVTGLESTSWGTGKLVGTSPQDIWFSALSRAFHFDGAKWTIHDNIKARSIFQLRKDDVWVGDKTLQHWDGTKWSDEYVIDGQPAPGIITSISGSSDNDVWAVGYNGSDGTHPAFSAHWNGTEWKLVPLPAGTAEGPSVYAPSPLEAFIATGTGVYRWDGTEWKIMTLPSFSADNSGQPSWAYVAGVAKPRP